MAIISIFIVVCGSIVEADAIAVDNIASKTSVNRCIKRGFEVRSPQTMDFMTMKMISLPECWSNLLTTRHIITA